jgi:ATP/maltotriose-dependent transcriptional regulator MalT
MSERSGLAAVPDRVRERTAEAAVRAAMRYRVALVFAPAGWGKTVAVRTALEGAAHRRLDCTASAFDPGAARPGELIVADGVDRLDAASRAALIEAIREARETRWLLIGRERAGLPVSSWIAAGDAGAPVLFDDLALGAPEIEAAARELGVRAGDATVEFVLERTGGWPVAVRFALAALERSPDLSRAHALLRGTFYDYLTRELLEPLSPQSRELLFTLALSGPADETLLAALGRSDPAADAAWLREAPLPCIETADGFALQRTFAQFLVAQIPAARARELALRAAPALRANARASEAFEILRAHAPATALEELRAGGFALLEAGCWQPVEAALRGLPQAVRREDAIVVCLRAQLEAQNGNVSRASDLYERALRIAATPVESACVSRQRAVFLLNQADARALEAIEPALQAGSEIDLTDARGIRAMALSLTGSLPQARLEVLAALDAAKAIDDDRLVARALQRAAYVEYQCGDIPAARRYAGESADLARRTGSWFQFICAHSVLYAAASASDDHAAALWHAEQIGAAAAHTGDRRHRLYALSARYVLEVERGRAGRALAIEAEIPVHTSRFRDELPLYVALAMRKSWDGAFAEGYRLLASIGERVVDPMERRLLNAALAMLSAFAGDERGAAAHLRACGKATAALARENAVGNAEAECFAAVAQILLGQPEAALRRLPHRPPTIRTRALASFARALAGLGPSLSPESAENALERLRAAGQEGFAMAAATALGARRRDVSGARLTDAERRVLAEVALGTPAVAIAQQHGRSIHTIRNQIKSAARKLGASGSIEAVARAKRLGLIE